MTDTATEMALQVSTLRPGLLVRLSTTVSGNIKYRREIIDPEHITEEGAAKETWTTERTIIDPDEHARAIKIQSRVNSIIRAVCAESKFGLMCPEEKEPALRDAVREARQLAASFTAGAKLSRVDVYIMTGRVAADDVEAVRSINSEIRGLLAAMQDGLRAFDVQAIRDAADRAKSVGTMLAPEAAERVKRAIEAARKAARDIVKAGETAAREVDSRAIKAITEARTSFLDLDPEGDISAPDVTGRALDLDPEDGSAGQTFQAVAAPQFALEL